MSTKQAEKAEKAEKAKDKDEIPFEQVFRALEQRVEGLAARVKELASENARLKAQLEELRKAAASHGDEADRLRRLETEREEIRTRIERLLGSLAEAEGGPTEG